MSSQPVLPANLSPENWPADERKLAEEAEIAMRSSPPRMVDGPNGLVTATMSPIAIEAGIEALRQGGTAADAAATVALTQVTTALGSYVSDAGVLDLLYYDAASGKVSSLNAGWTAWTGETRPATIARNDSDPRSKASLTDTVLGRRTLVPGFMAGIDAMHKRFGRLPFATIFQPAIWYAEHGITVTPLHAVYFQMREKVLSRTEEGQRFLHQAGDHVPRFRDRFVQSDLAATLSAVAERGAAYMYSGPWGEQYVAAVNRDGGKASMDDMRRYQPVWEEPLRTAFLGDDVFAPGASTDGGYAVLEALNLVEERKNYGMGPYWKDPHAFRDLSTILQLVQTGQFLRDQLDAFARRKGIVFKPGDRATKAYAHAISPFVDELAGESSAPENPAHSDAVVVIDRKGKIAALVHSINSVIWGATGIVVGGIPVSDAAGINQYRLGRIKPGSHVPNEMGPVIVMRDSRPVLATAAIGSSLTAETVRLLTGILGNHLDAATVIGAPPLLDNYESGVPGQRAEFVPRNAYDPAFLKALEGAGVRIEEKNGVQVAGIRGIAVLGVIDAGSGARSSVEARDIHVFARGY